MRITRTRAATLIAIAIAAASLGWVAAGSRAHAAETPKAPEADKPVEVMVVGMFHMANPGRDLHDLTADDVRAPKRQAEIAAVAKAMARFRPTLVAVEWEADTVAKRYPAYTPADLKTSRNEVVQLGFRLAHNTGARVVGIDKEADFPFEPVEAYAKAHGEEAIVAGADARIAQEIAREQAMLKTGTISGLLRHLNAPKTIDVMHSFYREMLRIGGGDDQPGAALLTAWYGRNFQICARLVQAVHPGDHVVVFYGAGHAFQLRQCAREMPGYKLVDTEDYLPK